MKIIAWGYAKSYKGTQGVHSWKKVENPALNDNLLI